MNEWDEVTIEIPVNQIKAAYQAIIDAATQRRRKSDNSDSVGQLDNSAYGGDWENVTTTEFVLVDGKWISK